MRGDFDGCPVLVDIVISFVTPLLRLNKSSCNRIEMGGSRLFLRLKSIGFEISLDLGHCRFRCVFHWAMIETAAELAPKLFSGPVCSCLRYQKMKKCVVGCGYRATQTCLLRILIVQFG